MSFSLDLSKFAGLTEKKLETVVKKTFIGLSADIIRDTPVDTGRLKNNWFPAINKFSDKKTNYTGGKGTARTNDAIRIGNKFELGDTLTLTNNLPYAKRIEFEGWSKKAPAGMVRKNIIRWQTHLDEQARKLK